MTLFVRERITLSIVAYALYLYLSGLYLRRVSQAVSPFIKRSYEAVWKWLRRFSKFREVLHAGRTKAAIVDERSVNVAEEQDWIWLAVEPRSWRLLAVRLSWTRNILVAYSFLKHLRDRYGVRMVVVDGAQGYVEPCHELGLLRIVQRGVAHTLIERLSKEVKRRLKDFDLHFSRIKTLRWAEAWLRAWKAYYNWVRHHMTLKGSSYDRTPKSEPYKMLKLIKETP